MKICQTDLLPRFEGEILAMLWKTTAVDDYKVLPGDEL